MAGLYFNLFRAFECPVSGKRAALPRQNPKTGRRVEANFAALATGRNVRISVIATFIASVRSRPKLPLRPGPLIGPEPMTKRSSFLYFKTGAEIILLAAKMIFNHFGFPTV